jgi:hypothetical protein
VFRSPLGADSSGCRTFLLGIPAYGYRVLMIMFVVAAVSNSCCVSENAVHGVRGSEMCDSRFDDA